MIKIQINKICAKLIECEPLTSGMIGKLVEVSFSSEWSELNKIAVFSNGDVTIDVLESQWNGNTITIPHEVLATPHRSISMGVYGYEIVGGEKVLAIPTIVAEIGKTKFGADPSGDPEADPTLPIWAQLQWEIDHFEVDPEIIAEQVQLYLDEHPITISPATASVLGGIKVGANLSITADGTLSADAVDLSGYATEAWVLAKNYLTQHQSLAAYRTAAAQNIIDASKQDTIADLASIRSGAALGATALQSVPNTYRTSAQQDIIDNGKQDKDLVVSITQSGATYTADKTNAEIYAAWQAGREVKAELNNGTARIDCVECDVNNAYFALLLENTDIYYGAVVITTTGGTQSVNVSMTSIAQKSDLDGKQDKALIVNITESGGTYTADKTNAEIDAAWLANKEIIAVINGDFRLQCVESAPLRAVFSADTKYSGILNTTVKIANDIVTVAEATLQPAAITDTAGYFTTDTVEGALAEIGGTLNGLEVAINTIRGVS